MDEQEVLAAPEEKPTLAPDGMEALLKAVDARVESALKEQNERTAAREAELQDAADAASAPPW